MHKLAEMPRQSWARVWRYTLIISLISGVASVGISEAIMLVISQGMNLSGAIAAFVLPLILGGPIMFYMMMGAEQLKLANRKLEILAATDWLTGTLNRRAFTGLVDEWLAGDNSAASTLLVIDADHFKQLNDRHGHESGDRALQMIADCIRAEVDRDDLVGRIGGEEFGVLLKGRDGGTAHALAEQIRTAISNLSLWDAGRDHPITVSAGGATSFAGASFATLFRTADERLYKAKRDGRNRVELGLSSAGDQVGVAA